MTSRTQVSFRAYYYSDGRPLQSLHIAGETEDEARHRVLQVYSQATIELETVKTACCASCAAGGPCEKTCGQTLQVFASTFVGMAGESLLAVYDDASQEEVVGCGACSHTANPGQPAVLRFEKAKRNPVGGYSFEQGTDVELSPELQALFSQGGACQGGACLPWVRVQRDPQRFRAALHAARNMGPVTSSRQFYNLIKEYMVSEDQEVFVVVLLDVHANVRGIGEISRGARDRVLTPVPDVLRLPLVDGATQFVVAHNHPSGKTTPSDADKEVTKAIKKGADAVGLLFIDHIIVGANGYYSFHDHRLV